MGRLPVAIQVYSVRDEAEKDFAGSMKQIREMGYEGVELAGLYGHTPEQIKVCLEEVGLVPISAHVPLEQLAEDVQATVAAYAVIGCKYIAIPYLVEEKRYHGSFYGETLKIIDQVADECKKHDIVLLYHNHDFEFVKTEKGTYFLDELFGAFSKDRLQTELDTCWVKVAGESPEGYLEKYKDRCPLVHMKDFSKKDGEVELLALGEGVQDVKSIMDSAKENGAKWLIIEQDSHTFGTPMGNMKKSLQYLQERNV